jgi:signal transduction histidine kinase/ActR/RegA family two-component response regulator
MKKNLYFGFFTISVLIIISNLFLFLNSKKGGRVLDEIVSDIMPGAIAMSEMAALVSDVGHYSAHLAMGKNIDQDSHQKLRGAIEALQGQGAIHLAHEKHIGLEEQKAAEKLIEKINILQGSVEKFYKLKVHMDIEMLQRYDSEVIHQSIQDLNNLLLYHKDIHLTELGAAHALILVKKHTLNVVILTSSVMLICITVLIWWQTIRIYNRFSVEQQKQQKQIEQDFLEKKQIREKLHHVKKMEAIGTLAGGIAHDFNNILSAILGYTELSLLKVGKESELAGNLRQIKHAGLRAKDLVAQILTFSRGNDTHFTQVDLTKIIQEVLKLLRSSLPSTITMQQNLEKTSKYILADPVQIHQVLMNLGVNALHAMKEHGGTLAVNLSSVELDDQACRAMSDLQPGRYAELVISDTGCGMDKTTLERIFDPFFTTKEKSKGTGLGLSTVHGIVKRCRGAVSVISNPGRGARFTILFPICSSDSSILDEKKEVHIPGGTEHILLVDDEDALVTSVGRMLEYYGYSVTGQTDSEQALKLFRDAPHSFDMVITDYTMPRMTGKELTLAILAIRPEMPIIICTGFTEMLDAKAAIELGASDFVMKPLTADLIASAIRRVFDKEQ